MTQVVEISDIIAPLQTLIQQPNATISELVFDSRKVILPAQSLFFAIQTQTNDGHRFIPQLVELGVKNFVVSRQLADYQHFTDCNFWQVTNPVRAMQQLAVHHRQKFHFPIVGITGSNGKTIVKEWLAAMLSEDFQVVKNPNSYNSQIGVAFSVWQLSDNQNFGIFEAGISQPNEMTHLAEMIQPTIGILTNIGAAHAQFFIDNKQKLTEKLNLFADCKTLVYCADNQLITEVLQDEKYAHLQKISWGKSAAAHFRITKITPKQQFTVVDFGEHSLEIPFTDAASVENALHCAATLAFLGFPFAKINQKLASLTPIAMRMELKEALNQSILINDTYSLDFNSLRIALDFLNAQKQFAKKTLILSDFEQIQQFSDENYQEIADLLRQNGISKFIAVGEQFYQKTHFFSDILHFFYRNTAELMAHFGEIFFQNEAILIKGARSFQFEKVAALLQSKTHQTVLNVHLPAIIHNLNYYRSQLKPTTKMVAMVKAQSYGLGDAELINELQYHHIDYLAVAYTDEGVNLRRHNIRTPIIVLGAEAHSFDVMIQHDLEPEIYNFFYFKQLEEVLKHYPTIKKFKIHLKMDTGMHRLGFSEAEIPELIERLKANPQFEVASIFSHLAAAEDASEDEFTRQQIARFDTLSSPICAAFDYPILRHILNSSGISRFPEAQFDMVRLGLGLYGFSPLDRDRARLQNTITLKTIVTQLKTIAKGETVGYNRSFVAPREMQLAIIPIGYADGYPRELSNNVGHVLVAGKLAPIVGKICMDMCMVDVTDLLVNIGDEVIVYGDIPRLDDVAVSIHKTPYELLTAISRRVPRIYVVD